MNRWIKRLRFLASTLILSAVVMGCSLWKNKEEVRFSAIRFFQTGNVAFEQMDFQESIINYHKAIEMDDQTAEFHYNLGLAYFHVEKYKNALTAFENASRLSPEMADTYYNVALIYNKLFETEKAHKFYNKYQSLMAQQKAKQIQNGLLQTANPAANAKAKTMNAQAKKGPVKPGSTATPAASAPIGKKAKKALPGPINKGKKTS
ncbi:MAG: tetratricopeptide repeat protein [SAR324 cluster bacterium]|nr:tetratricopeptide repeat protein [SAR324 cluster bacterium]